MNKKHPYSNAPIFRVIVMIMKDLLPEWPVNLKETNRMTYTEQNLYKYLRTISKKCWKANPRERPQIKDIQATLLKKIGEPEMQPELIGEISAQRLHSLDLSMSMISWATGGRLPIKKALIISVTYAKFCNLNNLKYSQLYIPYARNNAKVVQQFLNGMSLSFEKLYLPVTSRPSAHYDYEWENIELIKEEGSNNATKIDIVSQHFPGTWITLITFSQEYAIKKLVDDAMAGDQFVFVCE